MSDIRNQDVGEAVRGRGRRVVCRDVRRPCWGRNVRFYNRAAIFGRKVQGLAVRRQDARLNAVDDFLKALAFVAVVERQAVVGGLHQYLPPTVVASQPFADAVAMVAISL